MFNLIKHHASVAACLLTLSIKKQLEWLLTFVSFMISLPVNCAVGLILIYVLINNFSPFYGWSFKQMVFMYGLAYISDGLATTFASQARRIEVYITRGDFDRSLVRPMSVLFQLLFRFIYLGGIIEIISGLIIFVYGCGQVGFVASFSNITKVIIVIIGATLIRIASLIIMGSVAFWTKRSAPLIWGGDAVIRMTTQYPLSVYPRVFQSLFTFILPFGFISYYPCSAFFGVSNQFNLPLNYVFWTPCIGIIMFTIANRIFNYGLKIYESAGA